MGKRMQVTIAGNREQALKAAKDHDVAFTYDREEPLGPLGEGPVRTIGYTDAEVETLSKWLKETEKVFPSPAGALILVQEVKPDSTGKGR